MATSENIQKSGDVRVEEIYIITSTGEVYDLQNFYMSITLQESIYSPCIFGNIVINDAANILSNAPIVGRELITIKLRTPAFHDSPDFVIHKTFAVYSVTDRVLASDREQFYKLEFMSLEGMKDNITRLTQKFKGGTDTLAESIFSNYVSDTRIISQEKNPQGDSKVYINDTPHNTNNLEFVANHWSPFRCLNFLAKNAVGNEIKMPNFMFFESNKQFYFTSITKLIDEQKKLNTLYDEYSYVNNLDEHYDEKDKRKQGQYNYMSPFISMQQLTVEGIYYPTHFDQLRNQDSGYYGSTTFAYDYVNKDIYNIQFDYTPFQPERKKSRKNLLDINFDSFKHITKNSPIFVGEELSDPLSKISFKAGASGLFSENDAFDITQVSSVCFRDAALAELDVVKFEITVPGKTDIEVGRLIRFNYPNVGEKTENPDREKLFDQFVSGIYLITGIRHDINREGHKMLMEIVRDSLGDE